MTMQTCWRRLALLIVGVALTLPQSASADTASCTQAHAAGQRAENAGHLKQALASFQTCASDSECPLPIRNDCTNLYTTVEARLPTVVFSVVDGSGNDVIDVKVSSAETLIVHGLDGRPVPVDPGLHEFRFQLPTGQELTKSVVIRQGEKDRIVSLRLPREDFASSTPAEAGAAASVASPGAEPDTRLTVPVGAWIAYGVGAAALVSWGTFGLLGRNQEKGLLECSPNCQSTRQDDYDAMKRDYLIADISLGVGAAAVVAGTVILLTMGRRSSGASDRVAAGAAERSLSVSPVTLGRVGGGVMFEGRY